MKRDHDAMVAGDSTEENTNANGNDDDMEEDDIEMDILPYDLKLEGLPSSPIFTPEFAELGKAISEVVQLLAQPIEESSFRNGVVNGLLKETTNRTKSETPEEVRIAFVGNMSSGKSTLINNILNQPMIARSGDSGNSCTWVVNSFQRLLPQQTMPYMAEVSFFSQDERHAIIHSLFGDYYRAAHKDEDACDDPKDGEQVAMDSSIRSSTITGFRALFNDTQHFCSTVAATSFLASATSEDDEAILDTLCEWADALMGRVLGTDTTIIHEASTTQSLLWSLAPFQYTVEQRDGEPMVSPWPFVSYIRFGLDSELLKAGVVLCDLPGLSDANQTRVNNAMNHLRQCSHYMIISQVGKAGYSLTDPSAPCLSAEGTGIPALRQHLLMSPGQAQVNEKTHTVHAQLPALLSSFNLYVMKTHMARKGEVEATVAKPRPAAATLVENLHFALNRALEDVVLEPFRNEESRWVEDARDLCKSWAKNNNTTQHLTLLKNNGFRKIKGRDAASISWSAELISINAAEIRKLFLNFDPMLNQVPKGMTKSIKGLISGIVNSIENDPQVTLMALAPFVGYLKAERETIARMVEDAVRNLRKDISNSMTRSMSEMGDNYIAQAMLPVYSEAREIKGKKGTVKDRLINFERNLCKRGTGVWGRAHDALRTELENMTEKHTKKLNVKIQAFFLSIEEKFSMLCGDEKEEVEEEVLLRQNLQKSLVLANLKMENEVRPLAEKCFGKA
ncbi:hypothetical protein LTR10_000806 [Elasticomyces elasticus]|nr:hypothetical protein LTR10_000806 [Elasticomyces elasticus]KAK4979947.1 hypothetical protein LTR42_000254 [Elasticomyces elasticus]